MLGFAFISAPLSRGGFFLVAPVTNVTEKIRFQNPFRGFEGETVLTHYLTLPFVAIGDQTDNLPLTGRPLI